MSKKKIIVRAAASSASGYGEHARFVLRALKEHETMFDIYLLDIPWGKTGSLLLEESEFFSWINSLVMKTQQYQQSGGTYDISVQVTIPNEFMNMAPINIGVSALIETDRVAPQWIDKCNFMHKIITISEHAKQALLSSVYEAHNQQTNEIIPEFRCIKPVDVISYPVKVFDKKTELSLEFETEFNFLCVAQWSVRKNIEHTIGWFLEEFAENEKVGLVLKLSIKNNSITDRYYTEQNIMRILERFPNRKCKIYLLHGFLSDEQMNSLYNHKDIKALISIPHGESFGLPVFEAAYNGIPVISTLYGGQRDFLCIPKKDKEKKETVMKPMFAVVEHKLDKIQKQAVWKEVLVEESNWCYVNRDSFRKRLREVYFEHPRFKQQAAKLKKYLHGTFTEEKQNRLLVESIIGEKIVTVNIEDLPLTSIITSVFDAEEYMDSFCKDVVRQTIFKDKIEWVIVHPKTSPGFEKEKEIILQYKEKYDNIKYIEIEEDNGLYACWNIAIKNSKGEYITNWNADDRRAVIAIEKQAKELFANEGISAVYMDSLITDKPNETFEKNSSNGRKYNFAEYSFDILKMMQLLHSCPMWERKLHDKYGYFDEKYRSVSDWSFFLKAGSHGERFKKMSDCLGLYLFSSRGISTDPKNFKWKREEEKEVYNFYKDLKVDDKN